MCARSLPCLCVDILEFNTSGHNDSCSITTHATERLCEARVCVATLSSSHHRHYHKHIHIETKNGILSGRHYTPSWTKRGCVRYRDQLALQTRASIDRSGGVVERDEPVPCFLGRRVTRPRSPVGFCDKACLMSVNNNS